MPGRLLKLEVLERSLIDDPEAIIESMQRLKRHGVGFAIDDFGTGYSSLAYLTRIPFDTLKIDKSFVEDIDHNRESRAITRATLQIAKALNMSCTAEGVETETQKQFLTDIGCDELQGFLISRPQPLSRLGHLFDVLSQEEADMRLVARESEISMSGDVIKLGAPNSDQRKAAM